MPIDAPLRGLFRPDEWPPGGPAPVPRGVPAWRTWLRRIKHAGLARHCVVCGARVRHFLPHGVVPRPNVLCPVCLARDRHRLLWLYLERESGLLSRPQVLLHLAPEPCLARRLASRPGIQYISGDLFHPAMFRMDILRLPLRDQSVTAVICSHVLNMLPADGPAFAELFRVTKPGGTVLLQVPHAATAETIEAGADSTRESRLHLFRDPDMYRRYGQDFAIRAASARFAVEPVRPFERFAPSEQMRYGLLDEPIFVCRRPA